MDGPWKGLLAAVVGVFRRSAARTIPYLLLLVVAGLATGASAASAREVRELTDRGATPRPRTLVTIGGFVGIVQDGNRLAWIRRVYGRGSYVESFDIERQRRIVLGRVDDEDDVVAFGFAGTEALLAVLSASVCSNSGCVFDLNTTSWAKPRLRSIGETSYEDFVTPPIAGGGGTLVGYSHCDFDCSAGDGIYRVAGGRSLRVTGSSFPTALAAWGSRVALAEITTPMVERSSPAWSPSGDRIAFARTQRELSGGTWKVVESGTGIYVRGRGRSGGERRFVAGVTTSLDWSRDGRLVLERPRRGDDDGDIYVANADGSEPRHLTSGSGPRWSPDGSRIAFTRDFQILVMTADGSGVKPIGAGHEAAWSPDGTRLAVATGESVALFGADGTPAGRIPTPLGFAEGLDWSPDGSRLVLSQEDSQTDMTNLYIVRVDGGGAWRRVTAAGVYLAESPSHGARWSPDGAAIAFARGGPEAASGRQPVPSQLFVTNAAGRGVRRLTAPEKRRTTVSVRAAVSGRLRVRIDLAADVLDLALSPSFLAVLVREGSDTRIQVRDARTGALGRSIRVPRTTRFVRVLGRTVLFNDQLVDAVTGHEVRLPDAATRTTRSTSGERIVGRTWLAIEPRRLIWAEFVRVRERYETRVRSLALPAR